MINNTVHDALKKIFLEPTFYQEWMLQRNDFYEEVKAIPTLNVVDHSYIMEAYDLNYLRFLHVVALYPSSYEYIVAETWIPEVMKEDGTCLVINTIHSDDTLMEGIPEYGEQYSIVTASKILSLMGKPKPWTYSIWVDPYVGSYHQYVDDTDNVYVCYGDPFDRLAMEINPPKTTQGIN